MATMVRKKILLGKPHAKELQNEYEWIYSV
jgi:hypothetical protein